MKIAVGMEKQFVKGFVKWLNKNRIEVIGEPFEICGIWYVLYHPIDREQKQKCDQYTDTII